MEKNEKTADFCSLSCEDFCRVLASEKPVPGGGGASALAGALAAALGNMVGNLTVGKKKYAAVEEEIRTCNEEAEKLRERFLSLIQADADSFAPLAAVYRLPAGTPEERAHKEEALQKALPVACAVPEQIMECCMHTMALLTVYEEKGSVMAVSDAAAAAILCKAALKAASLNILINTKAMTDRQQADAMLARMEERIRVCGSQADAVCERAWKKLS